MKKLLLIIAAVSIVSCGEEKAQEKTQEEIIKENASAAIKQNMNDPESFELVSIDKIDTIVWNEEENKAIMRKLLLSKKENRQELTDSVQGIVAERKRNNQFASFDVSLTIRGNNSYGAKILTDYYVKFDKNYNVIETKQRD